MVDNSVVIQADCTGHASLLQTLRPLGTSEVAADAYIDFFTALWLGFMGSCIGSFLNVVAYRMPLGMSVIWKPSHCPQCKQPIRAQHNIPVLGWLWLRGCCRDCGNPISPRYAIVEFLLGLGFFMLAYVELLSGGANLPGGPFGDTAGAFFIVWNPEWQVLGTYAYHCLMLCLMMCLALIDFDNAKTPAKLTVFSVFAGCVLVGFWPHIHPEFFQSPISNFSWASGILGAISCALLAYLGNLLFQLVLGKTANRTHELNFVLAASIVGAFMGYQGLVAVVASLIFHRIASRLVSQDRQSLAVQLLGIASFVQLLFWMKISALLFG